jgi:hypothetical protein
VSGTGKKAISSAAKSAPRRPATILAKTLLTTAPDIWREAAGETRL